MGGHGMRGGSCGATIGRLWGSHGAGVGLRPWLPQYLMEGSYNKVFLAKGNIPAESYNFFIDILLDTIRSAPNWDR